MVILKIAGTTLFVGLSSIVGVVAVFPESFGIYPAITLYMTSDSTSSASQATDPKISSAPPNYQCKIATKNEPFDCYITSYKKHTGSQNKNQHPLNLAFQHFTEEITPDNLKKSENIFKVDFVIKDWQDSDETQDIELTVKNDTNSKKYTTLKPLSGTYKNKKIGTVKYLVGKSKSDVADISGYDKCEFENKIQTNSKVCKVFDFSSNSGDDKKLENLVFQKATSDTKKIVKDNYYLIEFDSTEKISDFKHKELTCGQTGDESKKVTFEDLKVAIYHTNSEVVLIV